MNLIFMYVVWSTVAVAAAMTAIFLLRLLLSVGPLIQRVQAIVSTVENFGNSVTSAAKPLVEDVKDLSRAARHAHAVIAAVRIGLDTFFVHRRVTLREPERSVTSSHES